MKNYDTIEVVEKGVDEIVEVEKFNPFHDNLGRFSNKNGFASYSANPNTRAGAMAIARSAAAGHGTTRNVHRDATSTGPTIRHNANWLGSGNQSGNSRWQGSATLRNRVEPGYGLQGASTVGSQWQQSNAQRGRTTTPGKKPAQQNQQQAQQQPQKPAPTKQPQTQQQQQKPAQQQQQQNAGDPNQTLKNQVQDVYLSSGDRLAIQARNGSSQTTTTTDVANAHYQARIAGKDISGTVDVTKVRGRKDPIDKIAELQGWNKAPTVTDDLETFQKAAKQSGCMMIRSVHRSSITGDSAEQVCKKTMTDGNAALGGSGQQAYGSGLYMVKNDFGNKTGRNLSKWISSGQQESYFYGDKQMMATLHPNAKVATPTQANQMKQKYFSMSYTQQKKYGDYGGYIASKGFDAAQWHDGKTDAGSYATVYNKSSLIFYSGVATE